MIGDNVEIDSTHGRKRCVACRKACNKRAPSMRPEVVEAVKRALQNGATIGQICHGKPIGGGKTDRKLVLTRFKVLKRYRQENPEFNRSVVEAISDNTCVGQRIRWSRVRIRAQNQAKREEINDYYKICAMLPASFPDKGAIVSLIFEDLLNGSLKRENVRARVKHYITAHNRMFPTDHAKFAGRKLVSLDAKLYEDGATILGDTLTRGFWD